LQYNRPFDRVVKRSRVQTAFGRIDMRAHKGGALLRHWALPAEVRTLEWTLVIFFILFGLQSLVGPVAVPESPSNI